MDVLAVREAARFAINYATTKGPIILEMATYRYSGHSMSDPGTSYRTRDEVQVVRQTRDPITSFKEKLLTTELATNEELKVKNDKPLNNKIYNTLTVSPCILELLCEHWKFFELCSVKNYIFF